ncbi:T-cell-interacting, activating receptor on myeloid cells protein 1-like isoform X2 [Macrotis lagotis]|uniref:T-cell-interacting, activating receptor on myeloid cells protein 1-like isoform X2 n=1 Tax=Macrotis lagotis TaxID=92651 RepID=UPI003D68BD82
MMSFLLLWLYVDQGIKAQMEFLSKPTIWAKPSPVVVPGTDVTLHCWMGQATSKEMTFTLLKSGVPVNEQQAEKEAKFSLPSVSIINAGSYSCGYSDKMDPKKKSVASDALDLVVTGSLPKPTFFVHPSPEVALGGSVILKCILPPSSSTEIIVFLLLKTGNPEPVQLTKESKRLVDFHLKIVRVQDAGLYRCIYYEKKALSRASEPSEFLNICVTGFLTKPSLTVRPSANVSLGGNVTFHCQTSACGTRFTLHKEGEERPVGTVDSSQNEAEFLISAVSKNHTGSYRCHHHTGGSNSTPSMFSEALEVLVTGERDSSSLETVSIFRNIHCIILSCAIILLFFLVSLGNCLIHFGSNISIPVILEHPKRKPHNPIHPFYQPHFSFMFPGQNRSFQREFTISSSL